jgi:hypothetical protein
MRAFSDLGQWQWDQQSHSVALRVRHRARIERGIQAE